MDLGQEGGEQLIPVSLPPAQAIELPAGLRADVEQGAERPGGQQPIAGSPEPAGTPCLLLERLDKRGLPDPRLALHRAQPPVRGCSAGAETGQRLQRAVEPVAARAPDLRAR